MSRLHAASVETRVRNDEGVRSPQDHESKRRSIVEEGPRAATIRAFEERGGDAQQARSVEALFGVAQNDGSFEECVEERAFEWRSQAGLDVLRVEEELIPRQRVDVEPLSIRQMVTESSATECLMVATGEHLRKVRERRGVRKIVRDALRPSPPPWVTKGRIVLEGSRQRPERRRS